MAKVGRERGGGRILLFIIADLKPKQFAHCFSEFRYLILAHLHQSFLALFHILYILAQDFVFLL